MIPTELLTLENIVIFVVFVVVLFLAYKIFKILIRAIMVGVAGFAFPWIVNYLSIPLPIPADIDTGLKFALLAVILLLVVLSFKFIKGFFKIITWPFRRGK